MSDIMVFFPQPENIWFDLQPFECRVRSDYRQYYFRNGSRDYLSGMICRDQLIEGPATSKEAVCQQKETLY